jgi:hypothetical protein
MYAEGWRRLWDLLKWLTAIGIGFWSVYNGAPALEAQAAKIPLTPGQVMIGLIILAAVPGAITFGFLGALEWVYRGFRPLLTTPSVAEPLEAAKAAPVLEPPPALPRPSLGQDQGTRPKGNEVVIQQKAEPQAGELSLHRRSPSDER